MTFKRKYLKLSYLGKAFFVLLVVMCFILAITKVDFKLLDENFSESLVNENFSLGILREDVTVCLLKIKQTNYEEMATSKTKDVKNIHKDLSFDNFKEESTVFTVLASFNNLLTLLDVKAVIIDPSVLYCMLSSKYQELLIKRRFNISHFLRPGSIVTYGIMQDDVSVLQEESNMYKFTSIGFDPYFVQTNLADWMHRKGNHFEFETFASHIFYKHKFCVIHLVVFHERGGFLWHSKLDTADSMRIPPIDRLNFVKHDSAFERFSFVSLKKKIIPVADFYVPTNPHYFLMEISGSRFLECNSSRAANVSSRNFPKSHPDLSVQRFNTRAKLVLRELKKIFHPLLMSFWIWSGTMLGWYRQCDIIPYTTDVDFASWASDIEDLDLIIDKLRHNKHMAIKERMGVLEEALEFFITCHDLRTDVFFMYQIENGSWCSGHVKRKGHYFRYFYPPFTLCSAELLGEKVQVPCETEDVILTEYGRNWSRPISSWQYQSSIRNRGPNIYWGEEKMKSAYETF